MGSKTMEEVFVTREIPTIGLQIMQKTVRTRVWSEETPPSKQQIIEGARGCSGLVSLLSDPIDAEVIESLQFLRVIAQYAVGFDNIDIKAASARGVIVTNTPGVLTETTADLTWALIMTASRRIVEADRYVREGKWKVAWGPKLMLGRDIHGAVLGVIGMGRIGTAVARRAKGFNMRILFTSKPEDDPTHTAERELGAQRVDLDRLLAESDIVTVHVPLTEETKRMIGRRELNRMKKGAVLVNTSRGAVVDEEALIEALESGHLHAAGLDVFAKEPLPQGSRLRTLPNAVLVPHIGSASYATRDRMAEICANNLIAALQGERPPNIVNPEILRN